jgi:hypothetical protein
MKLLTSLRPSPAMIVSDGNVFMWFCNPTPFGINGGPLPFYVLLIR